MNLKIPEDYIEFLYWIKKRTENFWSKDPENSEMDFVCEKWLHGAKWIGLTEKEIDSIEIEYDIKFNIEHREFLKVLHAIDKKKKTEYVENEEVKYILEPFFYNWITDKKEIIEAINHPYQAIFSDIIGINNVWLKSWGNIKPKSDKKKEKIFSKWYKQTPKIIPTNGYNVVVSNVKDSPVIHIYDSEIIVIGWNMKHYLLNELREHLDIYENVYDKEDNLWYSEPVKEFQVIIDLEYKKAKDKVIPIWEEMILYWSSSWASYGKEFPNQNNETMRPVIKTFVPGNELQ